MIPHFGKAVATTWQELSRVRGHFHLGDCVQNCHCKIKECQETDCMFKRMHERAHRMSGRGRAALLAWFAVMSERVAGCHAPVQWSASDRKNYIDKLAQISEKIANWTIVSSNQLVLIEKLAAKIEQTDSSFSA